MTETEAFRRQMPPPLAPRPLNLPQHIETTLPNGLGLVVVEDKRLPLISFRLAFRCGDANDPAELPGLSDMMSSLMTEGTAQRSSRQIASALHVSVKTVETYRSRIKTKLKLDTAAELARHAWQFVEAASWRHPRERPAV